MHGTLRFHLAVIQTPHHSSAMKKVVFFLLLAATLPAQTPITFPKDGGVLDVTRLVPKPTMTAMTPPRFRRRSMRFRTAIASFTCLRALSSPLNASQPIAERSVALRIV